MLLVLDVGNTNVTIGFYSHEGTLLRQGRVAAHRRWTADEYAVMLARIYRRSPHGKQPVKAAAMASVVPPLTPVLAEACRKSLGVSPLVVNSAMRTLPAIRYDDPAALGADRLANAVALWVKYGAEAGARPLMAIDFGTATKCEVVSAAGEYVGGMIAPGIGISLQALFNVAARLSRTEVGAPARVLGRNNHAALQSGVTYGFAGQADGLVQRVTAELGAPPLVVATGGYAALVAGQSRTISRVDDTLTLDGIRQVWVWNGHQT